MPNDKRVTAWLRQRIFIPKKAVCCLDHLNDATVWEKIPTVDREQQEAEYEELCEFLTRQIKSKRPTIDFKDLGKMSEDIVSEWTGLSKAQFSYLCRYIIDDEKGRIMLASFLIKLRRDLPFTSICTIVGSRSERTLRRWFDKNIKRLSETFVPENLGFLGSVFRC